MSIFSILNSLIKKVKNAAQTCKKICAVYGEDIVKECVCQKWFVRFCSEDFSVRDTPHLGRPVTIDMRRFLAIIWLRYQSIPERFRVFGTFVTPADVCTYRIITDVILICRNETLSIFNGKLYFSGRYKEVLLATMMKRELPAQDIHHSFDGWFGNIWRFFVS